MQSTTSASAAPKFYRRYALAYRSNQTVLAAKCRDGRWAIIWGGEAYIVPADYAGRVLGTCIDARRVERNVTAIVADAVAWE